MFVRMLNEAEPPAIEFVEHEINDGVRRHKLGVPAFLGRRRRGFRPPCAWLGSRARILTDLNRIARRFRHLCLEKVTS